MRAGESAWLGQALMDKDRQELLRTLSLAGQIGWRMVGSILVGFGLGLLLDRWFGVRGPFLIPFLLLGIGAGFWTCYRQIMKAIQDECPPESKT